MSIDVTMESVLKYGIRAALVFYIIKNFFHLINQFNQESRNGAYYEPLTSESDVASGGVTGFLPSSRKAIPISIRMSGRAGVSFV